jgi:hypothetical protein
MSNFWNSLPPSTFANEANVEYQLVLPLLYALGYETKDIASKYPVEFREGRRGRKPEADIVCFNGPLHDRKSSLLVVETKAPSAPLAGGKEQGESYAANLRAPVLVITNGQQFQAWQMQSAKESEKIIDLAVADIIANRGRLEGLLSKKALIALCERLSVKSFLTVVAQHKEYVAAEVARISKDNRSIKRTLRYRQPEKNQAKLPSDQLINAHLKGAIILAPSGFGKSTLSHQILRQALEKCSADDEARLPFFIPLPAIERGTGSLLQFMQQRLAAHSPGETIDTLKLMLRVSGAIILCDAFDRLAALLRTDVQSELSNIIRDFPLVQLIVCSRESAHLELPLPSFDLTEPSDEELRELEVLVLGHSRRSAFVVSTMPKTLRNICENMLVARLIFDYWKEHRQYPVRLGLLFRAWLDGLLRMTSLPSGKTVWQESALILLAEATVSAPIKAIAARVLLKDNLFEPSTIDDLIEIDALRVNGVSLELQHEALADYLRAEKLASAPEPELLNKLSTTAISQDSLFPTLLMSQLRSRQLQSALWRRLSETSLGVYLDALRYRFDLSEVMGNLDAEELSFGYFEDLLDGIEIPLEAFFPAMRKAVARYLTLQDESRLGINGIVFGPPANEVLYSLRELIGQDRIKIGGPETGQGAPTRHWLHLGRCGYRLDSGHLVGAARLRDTILNLIENQELEGGTAWISERLIGRIWHLQRSHQVDINETDTLEALDKALRPHAGKWVPRGYRQCDWFSIDSVLQDINVLRAAGMDRLDLWWAEYGWTAGDESQASGVVERVLAELYRRQQTVLAEVVEYTFPVLAKQITSYTSLPARWEITLTTYSGNFSGRIHASWRPVASWGDAGADISFSDSPPPWRDERELVESLKRLGRPAERFTITSHGAMPTFDGYWWDERFQSTTAVVREVCSLLKKDIEYLFSALPSNDAISRS